MERGQKVATGIIIGIIVAVIASAGVLGIVAIWRVTLDLLGG